MAVAVRNPDQGGFASREALGPAFALGRRGRLLESITGRFVALFDLGDDDGEERPPLALSLMKLGLWVVAGIAATSGAIVGLGALVVRIYVGALG